MFKFRHLFTLFIIVFILIFLQSIESMIMSSTYSTRIKTTWNNESIPIEQYISLSMHYSGEDLMILIRAPFYNDPVLPDWSKKPGTFDKLYNYEVVELFLLNSNNEHYLEIELAPRGQYLLLELNGYRNVTRTPISLKSYNVKITNDKHWSGRAIVSHDDLPNGIDKFNAYAIHGSGSNRTYLSLFPAPNNNPNYTEPDFHRLELFQSISLFRPYN
ncbi:hypothetical protein DERP_001787 [Dermatophagoides pteronyssinus]|uniref:Uncharacterized protein n=1 Tax=Dermatophagoides pteronyssinus TaxID=6956 RepID=A0ABQ8JBI0_DERPT|nr:hypothetical protein DERP_001787 [Dermatophagoides pteronyssinus]